MQCPNIANYLKQIIQCEFFRYRNRRLLYVFLFVYANIMACCIKVNASNYDSTYPEVGKARIIESSVYVPGTVNVELSDIVEDESGIGYVSVVIAMYDPITGRCIGSGTQFGRLNKLLFTGDSYRVSIPLSSDLQSGIYHISSIEVGDSRGNNTYYCSDSRTQINSSEYILKQCGAVIGNPNQSCKATGLLKVYGDDADIDLASSNPYIASKIQSMQDGKIARIFVDSTGKTVIEKSVFDAIKGTNKKINVNVSDGIKWFFDGKNIVNETKNINCMVNLSVVDGTEYGSDSKLLRVNFASNGVLPGKASIRIKSDYIHKMYGLSGKMYLYFVNSSGLKLEDNPHYILDGTDHWCEFDVTHNSTFVVSGKPLSGKVQPIKLNQKSLLLKEKQNFTLKIVKKDQNDRVRSFKSSNEKIATVNSSGKVTAKKTGSCTVTVLMKSGQKAECKIKVQKGVVKTTKITGLENKITLKKGKKTTLKPVLNPITAEQKIIYSSSNKKVATVSSKGVIQAKASGTAKITVKSGSKKVTIKVTVPKTTTKKITNIKSEITIKKGKSYTLKPKLSPKNSEEKITYVSSDKKVVTVNSKGKITAKQKGTAMVTVKSGKVKVICEVIVK
ncbi:hypothetical protein D7Y05_11775 [bacterium 1XD42-54]|nr:hypothetical protein D7Y05_11775 [bacterium 1XD42-54]